MRKIKLSEYVTVIEETNKETIDSLCFFEMYFYVAEGLEKKTNGMIEIDSINNFIRADKHVYKVELTNNENILCYLEKYIVFLISTYGVDKKPFVSHLSLICSKPQEENKSVSEETVWTDVDLAKVTGIPKDTLSTWKTTEKDNWRQKHYRLLKSFSEKDLKERLENLMKDAV